MKKPKPTKIEVYNDTSHILTNVNDLIKDVIFDKDKTSCKPSKRLAARIIKEWASSVKSGLYDSKSKVTPKKQQAYEKLLLSIAEILED